MVRYKLEKLNSEHRNCWWKWCSSQHCWFHAFRFNGQLTLRNGWYCSEIDVLSFNGQSNETSFVFFNCKSFHNNGRDSTIILVPEEICNCWLTHSYWYCYHILGWLLEFYVVAKPNIILRWVQTCESAHSICTLLYWDTSVPAPWGDILLNHIILTMSQPVLTVS